MPLNVAIIYNQPVASMYNLRNEQAAEEGVLVEVEAVNRALQALGYTTVKIPLAMPKEQAFSILSQIRTDVIFNLFEGFSGFPETEAEIVEKLQALGLHYTGSPASAIRLALDKAATKAALQKENIRTPNFQLLDDATLPDFNLNFPCIVKPNADDASHGVSDKSIVNDYGSLREMVFEINQMCEEKALVEEYIDGREFNMTVMGNYILTPLPISEICFSLPDDMPKILTFEAKWQKDSMYYRGTIPECPANIAPITKKDITEIGLETYALTGCCGYARIDMRMDNAGRVYVIEVNPNPDISPDSGASRQSAANGMTYTDFIEMIVQLALERK